MPIITIFVGLILCAIGLFGYFGSASADPSLTALIPAVFGGVFVVLGVVVARMPGLRMHVMHAAAALGLIGFAMAAWRVSLKPLGHLFSDDLTKGRPARMTFLMSAVCLVFVLSCIVSFIAARRRRASSANSSSQKP